MKGIVVALLALMLIPTANAQFTVSSDFCADSQTLLHNVTIIIDDGTGPPDRDEILNFEHCPFGCVEKFGFTSNTTLTPGQCAKGPLESSLWVIGAIIIVLLLGHFIFTRRF